MKNKFRLDLLMAIIGCVLIYMPLRSPMWVDIFIKAIGNLLLLCAVYIYSSKIKINKPVWSRIARWTSIMFFVVTLIWMIAALSVALRL